MPPVKLQKRERQATPDFKGAADSSIGEALMNALGSLHQASKDGTRVAASMVDTQNQNDANDIKRDLIEEERELARVTTLLSNPALSPGESMAIHGESKWAMSQIASLNKTGELKAQAEYGDMAVAMEDVTDTVEAREVLQTYMAKALEGEEDPSIRDGVIQRFADIAPKFLEKAAVARVGRANNDKHVKRDMLLSATLGENPDNFLETLQGEVMTEFGVGDGDFTAAVDAGIESLSNFYNAGVTSTGENPNQMTVLDNLEGLISTDLTMDAGNRKRALALRDSIHSDMESRVSSQTTIEDDEALARFGAAETEAMLLRKAGKVVTQEIYNELIANARTSSQKIRLQDLSDNLDAPGLSGTGESREVRRSMREEIGVDPQGINWDGRALGVASAFYDKGVRRLTQIEDPFDRYTALEALAAQAKEVGDNWFTAETEAEMDWETQQVDRKVRLKYLMESGVMDDAQIEEHLESMYDQTWLKYKKRTFQRQLSEWAQSTGIELEDLDI